MLSAGCTGIRQYVFMPDAAEPNSYVLTKDWSDEQERLRLLAATTDNVSIAAIRAVGFSPG
jgi:hypothetical protein